MGSTDNMRAVAIIPARGGSKRIPRKNIRSFQGKPLIAHTIEEAISSDLFERVIVSTEDEEIARIAKQYDADVPFLRSPDLADDHTHVSAVTVDALEMLDPHGDTYDVVAQLMANCPLRTREDLQDSFQHFKENEHPVQLSVFEYGWQNPWWAHTIDEEGRLSRLFEKAHTARSQDLPELYCITGAVWWARADVLRQRGTFHTEEPAAWVMPWQRAVDIDTPEDWKFAELLAEREPERQR